MASALLACSQQAIPGRLSPVNDYEAAISVQPGQRISVQTPDASGTKLIGVDVWSSAPYRSFIYKVQNGIQDTNPSATGGGAALTSWQWRTPDPIFIALGPASASINAYMVVLYNLDQTNTTDFYVTFHYGS